MDGNETTERPVERSTVSSSAAIAAAASADGAATAAIVSERAADDAAIAAENAVAQVERVEAAVENAGDHIAQVAAVHSEAAIAAAVEQIEQDIQEENTWLQNQLALLMREQNSLKALTAELSGQIQSRLMEIQSQLSNLNQSHSNQVVEQENVSGEGQQVPAVVKEKPAKKTRMI